MRSGSGRLVALAVAVATAAALAVPFVGAQAKGGGHHDHDHGRDGGKLLFFASDGLRQDAVEEYAEDTPGFRELLARRDEGVRPRPADAGAAEHRRGLVHALDRRLARRRRLDQQHLPHQRRAVQQLDVGARRPERPAGRDAGPGRRARRQEGRPDRVGRRPQRRDQRPDARLPQLPLGPRRGHELHRARGLRVLHALVRAAVRPSRAASRGNAPFPQAAPTNATGWTNVPRSYSPAKEMRLRVIDAGTDKYGLNAYIYDSRNDNRTRYDRVLFSTHEVGRRQRSATCARASGPTSRSRSPRPPPTRSTARPARS